MSKVNKNIFRKYDIRGIAESDLNNKSVELIGKAYGTYMRKQNKKNIIVGRDIRLSGKRIYKHLKKGLLSTGCNIINIGKTATPIFYFSIVHYNKDGGIMITASHNPPEYNGFKMCNGIESVYGDNITELYHIIENNNFHEDEKGKVSNLDVMDTYKKEVIKDFNLDKDLKVILDSGNGSAALIAGELFESLGLNVKELFDTPDGKFPNHPADPTKKENLEKLIKTVKKENADIGIGFDGDVDRIGVVDEKGNLLYGDTLLGVYAKEMVKKHPDLKVVFEVKCSQGLVEYLNDMGAKPIMWKAGHSLIKAKMKETGALLAGEMSGHMFFKDRYHGFDDAFYAGMRLLEILSETKSNLSELANKIPEYKSTPELRLDCGSDDAKFRIIKELEEYFKNKYDVIDVDGVRILFDNGWALVRSSNTQPVIVLRMESKTNEGLKSILETIYSKLSEYNEIESKELNDIINEIDDK